MHGSVDSNFDVGAIELLIKNGFYRFDTAPIYGRGYSIHLMSELIKKFPNIRITTKAGLNYIFEKKYVAPSENKSKIHHPTPKPFLKILKKYLRPFLISNSSIKKISKDIYYQHDLFNSNLELILFHSPKKRDKKKIKKFFEVAESLKLNYGLSIESDYKYWRNEFSDVHIQSNYKRDKILDSNLNIYRGLPKEFLADGIYGEELSSKLYDEVSSYQESSFIVGINSIESAKMLISSFNK